MTGYERIKTALAGKKPDKTPIMLHNFMMAVNEAGYTMEQYRSNPKVIAECFIRAIEKYKYDGIVVDIDTVTLAGSCNVKVDFPPHEPARSHTGILSSLTETNQLKPVNVQSYRYANVWCEAVALLKTYFKNEIYIRGNCDQAPFSLATMIRGVENMMMDLYLEEEKSVFTLLDYCYDATSQFIKMMIEAGADMVSNGDSPAGPSMLSPEMYEQFALPYEKKICAYAHQSGIPYLLHICGNTDIIIDQMITCGADALELDYKTNIKLAEEKMRGITTFAGNIDPVGVLAFGTPELVKEKTIELLEIFKDNPRFILNAGCAIPAITPSENLFAMIATARE
ncbi:uroporphyrinogen decarboxylase family protein [Parabacteroides segnis]|uniref:uroporphyrinogen decarboxylase family protein n=1 Tax=Parabacteroides segnis TaxID=2763058 RepID=UPI003516CB0C